MSFPNTSAGKAFTLNQLETLSKSALNAEPDVAIQRLYMRMVTPWVS